MKMREQEYRRAAFEIGGFALQKVIANNMDDNPYIMSNLMAIAMLPYLIDVMRSGYTTKCTPEYIRIKEDYNCVLDNIRILMETLGVSDDPVKIFVVFIHLYRSGLLSHNHEFTYDMSMKDLPDMQGADVIRGTGVCRSISALLTDIYKELGYDSVVLNVNANKEIINNITKNAKVGLKKSEKGKKFAKKIAKATTKIKMPNHAITYVENGTEGFILDPTNDTILISDSNDKIFRLLNDKNGEMINYKLLRKIYNLLGMTGSYSDIVIADKMMSNFMTNDEYNMIYLQTQSLIDSNENLFDAFYSANEEYYDDITDEMDKQGGLIRRMFLPFLPRIKRGR